MKFLIFTLAMSVGLSSMANDLSNLKFTGQATYFRPRINKNINGKETEVYILGAGEDALSGNEFCELMGFGNFGSSRVGMSGGTNSVHAGTVDAEGNFSNIKLESVYNVIQSVTCNIY